MASLLRLKVTQLVQYSGKVGHQNGYTLVNQVVGNAGCEKGFPRTNIAPKQKAKVLCLDLLPAVYITLSNLDIGCVFC